MFTQKEIKSIANGSETAKTVFDVLSKRRRFRRQTNLNKLQQMLMDQGCLIVEDDYINLFKELETKGVGSLIVGRKGNPNRFKWNYSLKSVAKAAIGNDNVEQFEPLGKKAPVITPENSLIPKRKPGRPRKEVQHVEVTLRIPSDMLKLIEVFKKAV